MLAKLLRLDMCWMPVGNNSGTGEPIGRRQNLMNYIPSFDQAAAKAAKMPNSRANTAVDLMAVGGGVQIEFKTDRELYKQRESAVACASVVR